MEHFSPAKDTWVNQITCLAVESRYYLSMSKGWGKDRSKSPN